MTHEFKTPISTISLAAQMLNDGAVLKSPAMLSHISTVINDETKRLRFQVEKVLQMSMFERRKATLRLQNVDANVLIANITSTFKLKVEKYGGKIEAVLDAEESTVNVDEMHFTNVIFNLLDNAVKYRREEEPLRLTVSTRNVSQHGDERIAVTIRDNGIGMKREDLKKSSRNFIASPPATATTSRLRPRPRLCQEDGRRARRRNQRGERTQCRNKIYNNITNN